MFNQSKMFIVLILIFLGCSAVAEESENCDRVQFSYDNMYGKNIRQNFTKQSFLHNGQPVYYSLSGPKNQLKQTIIWWHNSKKGTWLGQTGPYTSNKITKAKIKIFHQKIL